MFTFAKPLERHNLIRLAAMGFVLCCALSAGSAAAADTVALARQVEDTERAFAQSMAERDFDAFGAFLSDETVFFAGERPLRGKAAVLEAWKGFFEGPDAPFSWAPSTVVVLDSGALALSSGPVHDPAGQCIARFNSIWRREADGRWLIVFDKGSGDCPAAPAAE